MARRRGEQAQLASKPWTLLWSPSSITHSPTAIGSRYARSAPAADSACALLTLACSSRPDKLRPSVSRLQRGFDIYDTSSFEGRGSAHDIVSAREISDLGIQALQRLEPPFFLWLHYFDPHHKYLPHAEHDFGSKDVDLYDAEIAHKNQQLQRVLEMLQDSERADDTIVVVTADHGEEFFDHGR